MAKQHNRVLYYDTLAKDYNQGVICSDIDQLEKYWGQVCDDSFRLVYRPVDPQADFPRICQLVMACKRMWFVVEECDFFFKAGETCSEFKNLIQRGRHAQIEMVCVTQRPKGFGRLLTSQTDEFYVFKCKEPTDLDYYSDRLGRDMAEHLPALEQYHYLHYREQDGEYEIRKEPWP